MPFQFSDLDETTRKNMQTEIVGDLAAARLYRSPRLTNAGAEAWPPLLEDGSLNHDPDWVAGQLRTRGLLAATEQRRKPNGGYTTANVPVTAADTLAEGEFNRFYIRGLCVRAISDNRKIIVYRAKNVANPRPESEAMIGRSIDPNVLLEDLRASPGVDTALGLPSGPNSGLSVRLE